MDDKPYEILSPTKIKLRPDALWWAEQYFGPGRNGREQFARYLLAHERLGGDYQPGETDVAEI
jgi:hypothetical protein